MEQSAILTLFLPIALGIIMLGLGLSLVIDDFKRVVLYPKAVFIGLLCQMVILPVVCFSITIAFNLPPALAVGLMLLAASPGGATANLFSHLAKGDVALNVTLTAVNSVLTLFTLPFIVNFAIAHFMQSGQVVPMQFSKIIEVFAIVLVPVGVGMFIHHKAPTFAKKLEKPVKILSAVFLVLIIIGAILKERANFLDYFQQVGLASLAFNVISMVLGYFVPMLLHISRKQSIAIGMEIGIHNGTLAIYIALNVIGNSEMSIPPAVYSILMFFTAALFGYIVSRNNKQRV
ncbi:MAG: bile acid:sodium symporter family protein [Pedobacter sp.]|uniref:bile acid:sodium symporter family protein n=1 Tax=Pedobacter sp. TaxID=1411316 RepID=UPI0028098D1D|nr:bile acid:sodium symporter family protein [Pedobacter sp.]MDQ8005167.1 bile acid:sodium symporter family protein [Pedobacter sp.]